MYKKVYYLKSCNTSRKIIATLKIGDDFIYQNIKEEPITASQIDEMRDLAGGYEVLFSRRSRKYQTLKLKEKNLTEADYRKYILEEYTFLKRPVFIIDKNIFIGSSKENIDKLCQFLGTI